MKRNEGDYTKKLREFERAYWLDVFQRSKCRVREAARLSGVSPATAFRRMEQCGLEVVLSIQVEQGETT